MLTKSLFLACHVIYKTCVIRWIISASTCQLPLWRNGSMLV